MGTLKSQSDQLNSAIVSLHCSAKETDVREACILQKCIDGPAAAGCVDACSYASHEMGEACKELASPLIPKSKEAGPPRDVKLK